MNPIEQTWKLIRSRAFYNVNFSSLDKVVDCLADVICSLPPALISSVTARAWILNLFIEVQYQNQLCSHSLYALPFWNCHLENPAAGQL